MDPRVRHQIRLELCQVHVERPVKPERSGDGRHYLPDQPVEVDVGGAIHVQTAPANVVDGLVVHHESAVGVLECRVSGQDGVVWFNDGCGHLRRGVYRELQLGLLAVVHGEALHQERGEA